MTNTTDKAMREAFEAWLQSPECPITAGSRMTSASARVDETWQTWKAALASFAAEAEPHGWLYEDEMGEQVFVPGKIAPSWPWKKPAMTAVYTRPAAPAEPVAPSIEAAHQIGATGGPAVEPERLAFEAWMRGHCWALSATWNGREYRSDAETGGDFDPRAMATRRLWAAWRDRAALQANDTTKGK